MSWSRRHNKSRLDSSLLQSVFSVTVSLNVLNAPCSPSPPSRGVRGEDDEGLFGVLSFLSILISRDDFFSQLVGGRRYVTVVVVAVMSLV